MKKLSILMSFGFLMLNIHLNLDAINPNIKSNIKRIKQLYAEINSQKDAYIPLLEKKQAVKKFIDNLARFFITKYDLDQDLNQLAKVEKEEISKDLEQVKKIDESILDLVKNMQDFPLLNDVANINEFQELFQTFIRTKDKKIFVNINKLEIILKIPKAIKDALKEYLVEFPNLFENPNELSKSGQTILERAIDNNDSLSIERILLIGGNINMKDINGKTPLDYAILQKNQPFIEFFANEILKPYLKNVPKNKKLIESHYPLFEAILQKDLNAIKAFLALGGSIEILDGNGTPPIVFASAVANLPIVKLLVEKGANINAARPDGKDSIWFALNGEPPHPEIADYLKKLKEK